MPENPSPYDDDAEFKAWRDQRGTRDEDEVAPSVTFMEMMRQAAARNAAPESPATVQPSSSIVEGSATSMSEGGTTSEDRVEEPALPPPPQEGRGARSRRVPARRPRTSALGGCLRSIIIVLTAAGLTATIFTWATPNDFIAGNVRRGLSASIATEVATAAPTPQQTPNWMRRVGIVSGHRGPENDPGAVCPDGLTEAEVVLAVAQGVVRDLQGSGYTVDLLDEFDPRLTDYRADALVSIHANTCEDFGERVSGFIIASAAARISARGDDERLVECIAGDYARETQMERRQETTRDMTEYHSFSEIHPLTPAAIIELGFLLGDRQMLTEHQDVLSKAIADGVVCYLNPGSIG